MLNGNRRQSDDAAARPVSAFSAFLFPVCALLLCAVISGCAAPAEPIERRPPVPTPINDLSATQQGSDMVLTFTLPKETVQKLPLKTPPAVEIYRGFATTAPEGKNLSLVTTIPGDVISQYSKQGQIHYADALRPEDFSQAAGAQVFYSVRTRASEKKESEDSNLAGVHFAIPPKSISDAKAEVTRDAIVLSWTAPTASVTGSPVAISGYRVYRAELEAPALGEPAASAEPAKRKGPLAMVGETDATTTTYADNRFDFGTPYEYSIRSVISADGAQFESDDSNLVDVTPRDTFPPSTPQGLEAVVVPAEENSKASLDLSWAINPETNLAGYNIYRSEQEGARGERMNPELLRTPAFRDMNAVPGHRYFYTVTAVDTAGLESTASAPVTAGLPADSH
jgi:hypothetical protein